MRHPAVVAALVAGQPVSQALARLKDMGFRTVVNIRTEKEGVDSFSSADVDAVQKCSGPGSRPPRPRRTLERV
jgi:protein tyrosine phosphatase (PTP) superfamily phosphohydrolase (DUF442 family)